MFRTHFAFRVRAAFTLIELLVVIAIIAILASILFPVFARAREQGRKTVCSSQERQIGIGIRLYTQDYDESYPNTADPYLWVGKRFRWPIMPYLGIGQRDKSDGSFSAASGSPSVLICPSDTLSGSGFDATSYAYSAAFYHTPDQINAMRLANLRIALNDPGAGALCLSQNEASVAFPSQKVIVTEWFNSHEHGAKTLGMWGTMKNGTTPGDDCREGGRLCVFADGHVKFVQASRLKTSVQNCPDINLTPDGLAGKDLE